jgi:adenylate kinase
VFYEQAGQLSRINAIGEIDEVTRRALEALGAEDALAEEPAVDKAED